MHESTSQKATSRSGLSKAILVGRKGGFLVHGSCLVMMVSIFLEMSGVIGIGPLLGGSDLSPVRGQEKHGQVLRKKKIYLSLGKLKKLAKLQQAYHRGL